MEVVALVVGVVGATASVVARAVVVVQVPRATRAAREARDAVWAQESLLGLGAIGSQLAEAQASIRSANWHLAFERVRLVREHLARMRAQELFRTDETRLDLIQEAIRLLVYVANQLEAEMQTPGGIEVVEVNSSLARLADEFSTLAESIRVEIGGVPHGGSS